ncbi:putative amidotransferase-domain-containing protein [Lophiotrema nucula]|uniref:Putative amidotransferase-domain-containing protein n=1 Tax=Lophiotrema nucula TaxID=690887 RepID=A0A6A5ZDN0_9PLEO|nr:putative amidotransferase-domain-containing protein [Lophiotrema nucula]
MPSPPRSYTHLPSQADLFYFCTTLDTSEEDLNIRYSPPSKSSLRIGVLVLGQRPVQLLDLAAIDTIAMISRNRMSGMNGSEDALDEAVDEIDVRYVNENGEGSFPVTSGARIPVTNSFENAPQFDVLIIPGSFASDELPVAASTFLEAQTSDPELIAVMSIASGILSLAQTGLLHEKRATGPPSLLQSLRQRYPDTNWRDARWTRNDKIWSSSSALTAMDMVTSWMREYFWDRSEAVECALGTAGVARLDEDDY